MGVMTFRLPPDLPDGLADDLLRATVLGGPERAPTSCRTAVAGDRLILDRDTMESGPVSLPWHVGKAGSMMLTTATLMERSNPYQLPLELARGKLNQVRNQYAEWMAGGLHRHPELDALLKSATRHFGRSILDSGEASGAVSATQSLSEAVTAGNLLADAYVDQVFQIRHARTPKFDTKWGARLTAVPDGATADVFRLTFNSVQIPLTWRAVEPTESTLQWEPFDALFDWAESRALEISVGPLIDFSPYGMPNWVTDQELDLVSLRSLMCDFVESAVDRYRGRATRWMVAGGANGTVLGRNLSEEDLIRLTAMAADAAWQIDKDLPVTFGLCRPFSDYLSGSVFEYSAFTFADTLLRAGLPFAGIELEMVMGCGPRGSYCRDLLASSQAMDLFGFLGVPIFVHGGYPATDAHDPQVVGFESVHEGGRLGPSEQGQSTFAESYTKLFLAKNTVGGFYWTDWHDGVPHQFPNCGLIDGDGRLRPAIESLRILREKHLQ